MDLMNSDEELDFSNDSSFSTIKVKCLKALITAPSQKFLLIPARELPARRPGELLIQPVTDKPSRWQKTLYNGFSS